MDYPEFIDCIKSKKVVIWGCGYWGFVVCRLMEIIDADFILIDANPEITQMQSPAFDRTYEVKRPDYLKTLDKDDIFIIVAMQNPGREVYDYIKELGLEDSFAVTADKKILTWLHMEPTDVLMRNDPSGTLKAIEIETMNWCNNDCPFCPANRNADTRIKARMTDELLESILTQLGDMNYTGILAFFSNNEPLIDAEIVEKIALARKLVPDAYLRIATNGILLTVERFKSLIAVLDELIIDNYNDSLELLPGVQAVSNYIDENPELRRKVRIYRRLKNEVLTTRGGQAPNKVSCTAPRYGCILPFSSMIIRPDGKVSLCCSDPMGKYTLGDLSRESILDVWNGEGYRFVRNKLMSEGRPCLELCKNCDLDNIQYSDTYITKYIRDVRKRKILKPGFELFDGGKA